MTEAFQGALSDATFVPDDKNLSYVRIEGQPVYGLVEEHLPEDSPIEQDPTAHVIRVEDISDLEDTEPTTVATYLVREDPSQPKTAEAEVVLDDHTTSTGSQNRVLENLSELRLIDNALIDAFELEKLTVHEEDVAKVEAGDRVVDIGTLMVAGGFEQKDVSTYELIAA